MIELEMMVPLPKIVSNPGKYQKAIEVALNKEANELDKLFKQYYGNWEGTGAYGKGTAAKPYMPKRVFVGNVWAYAEVSTRGHENLYGNKKMAWLEFGTMVRWSIVSNDWVSKTSPGQIKSKGGGGSVLSTGRRRTQQDRAGKPGLHARNICAAIAAKRKKAFPDLIQEAINGVT